MARRDFDRDNVRYLGFSTTGMRGYIRLVFLEIDGTTAFVDYIAPAVDMWNVKQDMYRCLQGASEFMRRYELSHFYVLGNKKQQDFFADRRVDTIDLSDKRSQLPRKKSKLLWFDKPTPYIDLY